MSIRTLVVDDHPVVCTGLSAVLNRQANIEVAGTASSGEEALRVVEMLAGELDVAVVDYVLPGMTGAELTARLSETYRIRCLVLTGSADVRVVRECVGAGALGFLLKDATAERLAEAVRRVAGGEFLLDSRLTAALVTPRGVPAAPTLTDVEVRVLHLIGEGLANHEIAARLHVSTGTVKNHVSKLLDKLDAKGRAEAVAAAARLGLLDRPPEDPPRP